MTNRNPLPQLVLPRLQQLQIRIGQRLSRSSQALVVEAGPLNRGFVGLDVAHTQTFAPIRPGERFGLPDTDAGGRHRNNLWTNRWLRCAIPVAADAERGARHLTWTCSGETTVFIDGEPWAGLDWCHPTCPLPDHACELWLDVSLYNTGNPADWIGSQGVEFVSANLEVRDSAAWAVYHDLDVLTLHIEWLLQRDGIANISYGHGLHPEIRAASPLLRLLLDVAECCYDTHAVGGLPALQRVLKDAYTRFPAESWQPLVHLVGQSHLDLMWLWPEAAARRKAIHTMATQLRMMERHPGLTVTVSQPAMLRALAEDAPAQYQVLAQRIAEGRIELLGGFEVEADTHLPCGEALARSLVHGQQLTAELSGRPSTICWLPDGFGFNACLPQLLRLAGITSFFSSKMASSHVTRFPYAAFTWRGNDGSAVDAMCLPQWNDSLRPALLAEGMREHGQLAALPEQLLPVGIGDGGGGLTEAICERATRLTSLAGLPRTAWSSARSYFAAQAAVRKRLPVYDGEMYLEMHRGTHTSQAGFKAAYRGFERALQAWEAARAASGGGPVDPQAWRRLAYAQFHDALPGSSIGLVYSQLGSELAERTAAALAAAAADLTQADAGAMLFNPLPMARRAVVELPGAKVIAVDLPALAAVPLPAVPLTTTIVHATPARLASDRVQAEFDAYGRLSSLTVDGLGMRLVAPAGLVLHYDQPAHYDAWDIGHDALDNVLPLPLPIGHHAPTVVEAGPLRARLRTHQDLGDGSHAVVDYVLDAVQPWLQVEVAVEWRLHHRLLKYHLPTAWRGRLARFGCPFGSVERPHLPGPPADEAMWEVPMHRWMALGDGGGSGVAVVTAASYGVSVRDGDIGLSLLRGPTDPDPEADQGAHRLCFALGRSGPGTAAAAELLYTPPMLVPHGRTLAAAFAWDDLGSLLPSWVEPLADGLVLRAHETLGMSVEAKLRLTRPARSVELVDLLGGTLAALPCQADGGYVVNAGPHQVVSVRVRW